MANNPYVNKVIYGGTTLIDISDTTATADKILEGYTAYGANGQKITGTASGQSILVVDTLDENGGTIRTITAKNAIQLQTKTITPTSSQQVVNPDTGYDGFSQVTVEASEGQTINNQNKTVTPSEAVQNVTADSGYTGLGTVTVNGIPLDYVGSGIDQRDSSDLTASGATVTVPAGYYENQASKSVASGSAKPAASISGSSATVSTGTNTLTLTKSVSNTPQVTAGYISSGTSGNTSVSLTASVTTKAAATITPGTSNQTISSGTYLTGTQTIAGDANLVGSNIISGKSIFGVSGSVVIHKYYTGSSAPSSSLGSDGDIYFKTN